MKLHVGCGKRKLAGYQHQDIVQYAHVDFCCPSWKVPVADGVYDEIYSRHMFEHLYPWEAQDTLNEWKRILKSGGRVVMIVPDLGFHAKQLFLPGDSAFRHRPTTNFDHALAGFYGWVSSKEKYMAHHWGYTRDSLVALLSNSFVNVALLPSKESEIHAVAIKA